MELDGLEEVMELEGLIGGTWVEFLQQMATILT